MTTFEELSAEEINHRLYELIPEEGKQCDVSVSEARADKWGKLYKNYADFHKLDNEKYISKQQVKEFFLSKQKLREAILNRCGRDNINPNLIDAEKLLKELGLLE